MKTTEQQPPKQPCDMHGVSNSLPDLEQYELFDRIKLLSKTEQDFIKLLDKAEKRASEKYTLICDPHAWYNYFKICLIEWSKGNDY